MVCRTSHAPVYWRHHVTWDRSSKFIGGLDNTCTVQSSEVKIKGLTISPKCLGILDILGLALPIKNKLIHLFLPWRWQHHAVGPEGGMFHLEILVRPIHQMILQLLGGPGYGRSLLDTRAIEPRRLCVVKDTYGGKRLGRVYANPTRRIMTSIPRAQEQNHDTYRRETCILQRTWTWSVWTSDINWPCSQDYQSQDLCTVMILLTK